MGDDDKGQEALADGEVSCMWTPDDATANPDLKDVGAPPTGKAPNTGTQTMTITTNLGAIEVEVNTAKAPVHRAQHDLPGEQELLRQHQVPPAGHRGHQGAAVR